jgi:hypothetical protein
VGGGGGDVAEFADEMCVAKWLERLTANTEVATVLGSIPASFVVSEGRQMKQY